jgi:hypothetical protein
MEDRRQFPLEAALLTALAALMCLGLFAEPGAHCTRPSGGCGTAVVEVDGWIEAKMERKEHLLVYVEVGDQLLRPSSISANGRFKLAVPAGSEARLHFSLPGHLAKEVVLDSRDMRHTDPCATGYKPRRLEFGVRLEPDHKAPAQGYDGPVGTIGFTKGTALPKARHHKRYLPLVEEHVAEGGNDGPIGGADDGQRRH